jgi:hypothetical protein
MLSGNRWTLAGAAYVAANTVQKKLVAPFSGKSQPRNTFQGLRW